MLLQPLDEFEWECELREADRKAAAYQEALEKYKDTPDRDKRVAEAMGWDDSDEAKLDSVPGSINELTLPSMPFLKANLFYAA